MGLGHFRSASRIREPVVVSEYPDLHDVAKVDVKRTLTVFGIPRGRRLRWQKGERVAEAAGLSEDMALIREALTHDDYRYAKSVQVPGGRLWIFGGLDIGDHQRWDVRVRRLRDAGVLDALGATFGSAQAPAGRTRRRGHAS
jgi:hypothetical protein